jgi:plasmid stabilization system protein ParE
MIEVRFHPAAVDDLTRAMRYYEQHQLGLGQKLRNEVLASIQRIGENPQVYPLIRKDLRRCLVHRFPFSIVYRIENQPSVLVLVIRHHRQDPSHGAART